MALNNNTDVNGNKDAKKLLQQFLDLAQGDPIGYVAIVAAKEPNTYMVGFSGTVELEQIGLEGLKKAQDIIADNLLNRKLPERNKELVDSGSYVCYNVTTSPLSYDFLTWLITMEQRRIKMGGPAPLKVGFWYGRDGKTGISGMPDREGMLNNVCRPALELLGAVEDPKAVDGYSCEFFSYKMTLDGFKDGHPTPKFSTSVPSPIKESGYVTITLRETTYWPHRNSRLNEWIRFAQYLKNQGERVVFVRDTRLAEQPIEGFEICPEASYDLIKRCALYRDAKCNCFVANGPISLAYFGSTPWLKFFEIDDNGAYNAAKSEYWRVCVGLDPAKEEQFPWSTDKQRIVWKPDYFTNMVLSWEELWRPSIGTGGTTSLPKNEPVEKSGENTPLPTKATDV